MSSISALKKEVAVLHKALVVGDASKQREHMEKLLFYCDKLIELSRNPNPVELEKLDREIADFNVKHPLSKEDLIRLEPYKSLFIASTES